ncbi:MULTISPECIES: chalcone isomerase family protein [Pseudomonas]|uniref:chalcone isomerase family protein n=1 Tax=Pseudomonas TaxID=286 RepID=UPI0015720EBF|nr:MULTISPECIES: chalcone isomerase family protein [Pseudomonas]NSX22825.1 chalcone isomerase family protein [Pseudomonas putida]HDS1746525.1 chalcone isomerase family protein [Pseudomonas putida]
MAMRSTVTALNLFVLAVALAVMPPAVADWRSAVPEARSVGSGEFTWFGLRVYTARLWSAGSPQGWSEPFALDLLYHRRLSREALVQASLDEMRHLSDRPLPEATLERWEQAMNEAFVDVRPGMRITGVYLPGQGSRFYVDGQLRREIADPAFARAFFAIWLDPRARDPELRQRLLGLAGNDQGD